VLACTQLWVVEIVRVVLCLGQMGLLDIRAVVDKQGFKGHGLVFGDAQHVHVTT